LAAGPASDPAEEPEPSACTDPPDAGPGTVAAGAWAAGAATGAATGTGAGAAAAEPLVQG